jgi:hypothetical protein
LLLVEDLITDKKIKVVPERLFQAAGTTLTLPTAIKMKKVVPVHGFSSRVTTD